MLKIGDKVRFLNAVGGGIVRKFQSKDIVLVEEEDGFETPVLARECVVIESNENNFPKPQQATAPAPAPIIIRHETVPEEEYTYNDDLPEGENLTVLIAFIPHNDRQLQNTAYDAYLINDSNYFLFYNIATQTDSDTVSRASGTIEPNTQFEFATLQNSKLNDWERLSVQLIAFKKGKTYTAKSPVSIDYRINPLRFYKLHSFTENDYFDKNALIISLVEKDSPAKTELKIDPQQLREAMTQKKDEQRRPRIAKSQKNDNGIIEIDLHIHELLDSTAGMSNADMLQYQLEKFHQTLAENKNRKGQRIVFIHGKGEGVLRNEILKQLRNKYPNYFVQDASFREYGFGATMVTVK
ncbi:MAG: DUF2027 domain-containing protein [Prevotellaceae bacterium]|jgi:hypothetical protein|nr:DUF2027 domain-containing protein [Prevotellaceae bacterium]